MISLFDVFINWVLSLFGGGKPKRIYFVDPATCVGTGYDRNGDFLDPAEVAKKLYKAGLNATSIGFFGHDTNDFMDVKGQKKWLTAWVNAMREYNILTLITLTGTGGGEGGFGHPKYTDQWIRDIVDVVVSLGHELVMICPTAEGDIKEGATEPARTKFRKLHDEINARWTGLKGYNLITNPHPTQVPEGWIGIYHPQAWGRGYKGQLCVTDAKVRPDINQGQYPNEKVIPDKLTAFAQQTHDEGKGFIYWGQRDNKEIEQAALDALSMVNTDEQNVRNVYFFRDEKAQKDRSVPQVSNGSYFRLRITSTTGVAV